MTERASQAELVKNQVQIVKEKAEILVAQIAIEKALAEEKLEAAKPALQEAEAALNTIKPAHIGKSFYYLNIRNLLSSIKCHLVNIILNLNLYEKLINLQICIFKNQDKNCHVLHNNFYCSIYNSALPINLTIVSFHMKPSNLQSQLISDYAETLWQSSLPESKFSTKIYLDTLNAQTIHTYMRLPMCD